VRPSVVEPLFINAILGWLDDAKLVVPEESLRQLNSTLEVQEDFRRNPSAYGRSDLEPFTDPFLTELKRVRNAVRRAVAAGMPIARLGRARIKRALRRCGAPPHILSEFGDNYKNPSFAAERRGRGSKHTRSRKSARPSSSSATTTRDRQPKHRQECQRASSEDET